MERGEARRGGTQLRVTFHGVRGSCPCSGRQYVRYGGNTSCVAVEVGDEPPIVLDLGTGLRPLGDELEKRYGTDTGIQLTAFLTHLHWDHIIGLPFCRPMLRFGGHMDVYGPSQGDMALGEVIDQVVVPPFFPVQVKELHGSIKFHEAGDDTVDVGSAKVLVRSVPHVGSTLGFRIEAGGRSVAYLSDHQQPPDPRTIPESVLELCDHADLVIHDAQYTDEEFPDKANWGHSTIGFALQVAAEAGARRLVLYHHDPLHTDEDIDRILDGARASATASRLDDVLAAAEGMSIDLANA